MSEKFSLKWNDFHINAINNFSKLRTSAEFKDVTLVGDDLKVIQAHRLVLSSCSEYFKNVLLQHDHPHPLICLDGITSNDIENVLDFIYKGELQIFQEDLDRFLQIAQKLKLEGLLGNGETDSTNIKDETTMIEEGGILDANILETLQSNIETNEKVFSFSSAEFSNIEELESHLKENIQKINDGNGTKYKCLVCGKVFKQTCHAKEHVEVAHTEGLQFPCSYCDGTFKNRHALRMHKNSRHK